MINKTILLDALVDYKRDYPLFVWEDEKFKWVAIKWFQDHWDIEADAFAEMLEEALGKTYNLLNSGKYFAKNMIVGFAYAEPEFVREMFRELYDETLPLQERISGFNTKAVYALEHFMPEAKNHFQDEKAISIYLWLKYPDKYFIYKYSEVRAMLNCLESDYKVTKGKWNTESAYNLYNEMLEVVKADDELVDLFESHLTEDCYPDPALHTLTFDVGFYISRYYSEKEKWEPLLTQYRPGFSKQDWLELLNDKEIIGPVWGGALAAFYEAGGQATCAQIGQRYNKSPSSISGNCTQLAKRIAKETNCPLYEEDGKKEYWPILFQLRKAGADIPGTWIWKLRPELMEALADSDIMKYQWPIGDEVPSKTDVNYWWMLCNPKIWDFSAVDVGFEQEYTLYNSNGHKRRIFQNFLDAKEGDIIFGYMSTPIKKLVGLGVVTKAQDGERILFKKTEDFENPIDYSELKDAPELKNAEFMGGAQGSLFKVRPEEAEYLLDLIAEANPAPVVKETENYSSENFLNEVFMSENDYTKLKKLLERKKNVILQGAPGVGKTHSAKRLAYSIMEQKDEDRIKIIQFHQNYSYEDFIMGFRPDGDTFTLTTGVFYDFCKKAARDTGRDYFFIIDEINRGNLSKIFGELLMLIEADHRTDKVQLAYRQEQFSVPVNLYIIGMMNTADRSLALIDYALRRRFSFFTMKPDYQIASFKKYQEQVDNPNFDALIRTVEELNSAIENDSALGAGFCIGYSYFCDEKELIDDEWINSVVEYDLIPTLEEYWFDDQTKVDDWSERLRNVTK